MNQSNMAYHRPVLLNESIDGLNIQPKGVYIDLTFGGGGHALRILENLDKKGRLIAFDQDPDAGKNIPNDKRLIFVQSNFRYLRNFLRYHEISIVNGILADLGISSYQIDQPERGFSFRSDAPLDMRMNPASGKNAVHVINDYSEKDLNRIFRQYGEVKNASRVVKAIIKAREQKPVRSSSQLAEALKELAPGDKRSKFFARIYQAVRIEVNDEMGALKDMLLQTSQIMSKGGRLVIITYHSIEDRLVKNFMKTGNTEGELKKDFFGNPETPWKLVNRNVIVPSEKECLENKRARSAKLRVAERI
ncbi:MAG: 16S rRNA (cytosine(1402)-N(4))-methyltransferase RsmH [Bacteroidales bacterium]|nr:16S rRNA (cytosine(1402)-N(4))-methyltransferase RsmH [Bacteroidales bacterium]